MAGDAPRFGQTSDPRREGSNATPYERTHHVSQYCINIHPLTLRNQTAMLTIFTAFENFFRRKRKI